MTKTIKIMIYFIVATALVAGAAWAADGDERFLGGSFDGYTQASKAGMCIKGGMTSATVISFR